MFRWGKLRPLFRWISGPRWRERRNWLSWNSWHCGMSQILRDLQDFETRLKLTSEITRIRKYRKINRNLIYCLIAIILLGSSRFNR